MPKRKLAMSEEGGPGAKYARKGKSTNDDDVVERTNALRIEAFRERYLPKDQLIYRPQSPGESHEQDTPSNRATSATDIHMAFRSAQDLMPEELSQCFALVEQTSRPDYEASSWGWHPKRKLREMRDPEMRYLLVNGGSSTGDQVEGFLSFMITHDSHPPVPVLYIYEIHLVESLRKVGLGAHLMQLAEDIARRVGLRKAMLTCFLSNSKARIFYEKRGFTRDVCSPDDRQTRKRIVEVDYVIMSKAVEGALP
ncbi:hypothetical protein B0A54_11284 [Friedmanniomyces endolithicus]|uniref:N-alpha-acetyltransferase 40 n=1 Tax=Friedmanniomyces endolithicus TaxID=329885 RepID=A0A4V5N6V0_9PEZI|nr:hypothetical protein LTS09_009867 [Friedmanniomyces endolithicus]TKA37299.1 hypothetical protein B0A54_11284 [Friedmanniomyces endolithicus]